MFNLINYYKKEINNKHLCHCSSSETTGSLMGGFVFHIGMFLIRMGLLVLCYFNAHPHSYQETKSTTFALMNSIYAVDL